MKVLLDSCVWGLAMGDIQSAGHDVIWAGEWPNDPGDEEILRLAHEQGRVLVTLDRDFGELAIVHGKPHSGIIRLVRISARQQAAAVNSVLGRFGDQMAAGADGTVESGRVRVRPPHG